MIIACLGEALGTVSNGQLPLRKLEQCNGSKSSARRKRVQIDLSEDVEWKPFPAFPPSARLAVLVGDPTQAGPYLTRVKVPSGVKLMPHRHPEDRIYTVMSGVFYIGLGDRFNAENLEAFPPGSVVVLPGDTWHFHYAKSGEYVTQITAIGPLGMEYKEAEDDPRNAAQLKSQV